MSTPESAPAPATPPPAIAQPTPTTPSMDRTLALGEAACLGLAVLTLVAGLVVVVGFLVSAPALRTPSPAPDDQAKMYTYTMTETQRHQAAVEQRMAALQSFALMVGVALAFVGLGLLLGAARADDPKESLQARVARAVPGTVALMCAATVIIFAVPTAAPAAGQSPTAPPSFFAPTFPQAVA
jgi:hypothetical protein